jgi:hypothetical protein
MPYYEQSREIDREILAIIESWHRGDVVCENQINALFLQVARYQCLWNTAYRQFVEYRGVEMGRITSVHEIPAVPASAFKDTDLATFPVAQADALFLTSGTTQSVRGKHYLELTQLYRTASLAIFDRLVLAPRRLLGSNTRKLRFISVAPDSRERPESSLGFMVDHLIACRGDGNESHLLRGEEVDVSALRLAVQNAQADGVTLCIFMTALAALNLLEALGDERVPLPTDSYVFETGGFKGRHRSVERSDLYAGMMRCFGIDRERIIAEYGMTELTSQYYDLASSCADEPRIKTGPPWLRPIVVDALGNEVAVGRVGILRHYDLANRSSVVGVETEDLALRRNDGFVLLGREPGAELRGCSLDAEDLRMLQARA